MWVLGAVFITQARNASGFDRGLYVHYFMMHSHVVSGDHMVLCRRGEGVLIWLRARLTGRTRRLPPAGSLGEPRLCAALLTLSCSSIQKGRGASHGECASSVHGGSALHAPSWKPADSSR